MLQRYLLLWLTLGSLAAYAWPVGVSTAGWWAWAADPFAAGKASLPWVIATAMFAIGAMLPVDEIRQTLARWPAVLAGVALQFAAMPLLAYTAARLAGFEGAMLIGVVMVGAVPGAMGSNVLTLLARGNASYSVSLTTVATLAAPLVSPLVLYAALGAAGEVDAALAQQMSLNLLWTVVLPVAAGHLVRRTLPQSQRVASRWGPIVAAATILWIIAVVVGVNRAQLAQATAPLAGVLLAVNAAGYAAGWSGGRLLRLPEGMRRALTLEIGMQNAGLGATLALSLFPEQPQAAIAPAFYTFACMLTGSLLARWWAWRSERT